MAVIPFVVVVVDDAAAAAAVVAFIIVTVIITFFSSFYFFFPLLPYLATLRQYPTPHTLDPSPRERAQAAVHTQSASLHLLPFQS